MKIKIDREYFRSLWLHNPVVRVLTVAFGIIPVFLIYNALVNRLPIVVEITKEINSIQPLFAKVEKRRLQWPAGREKGLRDELTEAKSYIPESYKSLLEFVKEVDDAANLRGFKLSFKLGEAKVISEFVSGISDIPLNIILTPDAGNAGTVDFLKLLKKIVDNHQGIRVVDIKVAGSGEAASRLEARFIVMVGFSS